MADNNNNNNQPPTNNNSTNNIKDQNKLLNDQLKIMQDMLGVMKEQEALRSNSVGDSILSEQAAHQQEINGLLANQNSEIKENNTALMALQTAWKAVTSVVSVFGDGLSNIFKLGGMIVGVFGKFVSGVFNIGIKTLTVSFKALWEVMKVVGSTAMKVAETILLGPWKIINMLFKKAGSMSGDNPLRREIEEVRDAFGSMAGDKFPRLAQNVREYRKEFSKLEMPVKFFRYFGPGLQGLAEALKENKELLIAMGSEYSHFIETVKELPVQLTLLRKGLGMTAQQQAALMISARRLGKDVKESQREIGSYAVNMGKIFGIEAKMIGKKIGEMGEDFARFGTFAPKEMAKIAVQTHRLGIEIKDLLNLIDKFDNFENAANSAAMLSQAFGMNVDALELLKAEDPLKRVDMFQKAFLATGRSFEQMGRVERKYLAELTAMDEKTAAAAFGQAGLKKSYDDVAKGADSAEKMQITLKKAINELAYSIKQMVQSGGRQFTSFWDALTQGFMLGIERAPEMRTALLSLRRAMVETFQAGIQMGRDFVKYFPGIKDFLDTVKKFFSPGNIRTIFAGKDGIIESFRTLMQELGGSDPYKALENFYQRAQAALGRVFGPESVEKFLKSLYSAFDTIGATLVHIGGFIAVKFLEGLRSGVDILAALLSPDKNKASDITFGIVKSIGKGFENSKTLDALKTAASKFWNTFMDRVTPAFVRLWEVIKYWLGKFNKFIKEKLFSGINEFAGDDTWGENFGKLWDKIKEKTGAALGKLWDGIIDFIKDNWFRIAEVVLVMSGNLWAILGVGIVEAIRYGLKDNKFEEKMQEVDKELQEKARQRNKEIEDNYRRYQIGLVSSIDISKDKIKELQKELEDADFQTATTLYKKIEARNRVLNLEKEQGAGMEFHKKKVDIAKTQLEFIENSPFFQQMEAEKEILREKLLEHQDQDIINRGQGKESGYFLLKSIENEKEAIAEISRKQEELTGISDLRKQLNIAKEEMEKYRQQTQTAIDFMKGIFAEEEFYDNLLAGKLNGQIKLFFAGIAVEWGKGVDAVSSIVEKTFGPKISQGFKTFKQKSSEVFGTITGAVGSVAKGIYDDVYGALTGKGKKTEEEKKLTELQAIQKTASIANQIVEITEEVKKNKAKVAEINPEQVKMDVNTALTKATEVLKKLKGLDTKALDELIKSPEFLKLTDENGPLQKAFNFLATLMSSFQKLPNISKTLSEAVSKFKTDPKKVDEIFVNSKKIFAGAKQALGDIKKAWEESGVTDKEIGSDFATQIQNKIEAMGTIMDATTAIADKVAEFKKAVNKKASVDKDDTGNKLLIDIGQGLKGGKDFKVTMDKMVLELHIGVNMDAAVLAKGITGVQFSHKKSDGSGESPHQYLPTPVVAPSKKG